MQLQRKSRAITPEAEAWVRALCERAPGEFGYRSDVWNLTLLAFHIRACCRAAGHPALARITYRSLSSLLAGEQEREEA